MRTLATALALGFLAWAPAGADSSRQSPVTFRDEDGSTHARLERIDLDLRTRLAAARLALQNGGTPESAVSTRALQAGDELDRIELDLLSADNQTSTLLLGKLELLRLRLFNLETVLHSAQRLMPPPAFLEEPPETDLTGRATPPNDSCETAWPLGTTQVIGSTEEATNDGEGSCGSSLYSPDVWFRFLAPEDGLLFANTRFSDFDTVLSVYAECPGTLSNELACNDDSFGLQSSLGIQVVAGEDYFFRVAGVAGSTGTYALRAAYPASLSGTVSLTDAPLPEEGISVRVWRDDGLWIRVAQPDYSGYYSAGGLNTGAYFVSTMGSWPFVDELFDNIHCPGGAPTGCSVLAGTPVELSIGSTTPGVDFNLEEGGTISGRVTDESTGEALTTATVSIHDESGATVSSTTCNDYGRFWARGLLAGTYYASASDSGFRTELFDGVPCPGGVPTGCTTSAGAPISVTLGATTADIDFALAYAPAISGVVVEAASGEPVYNVRVEAWNLVGDEIGSDYTDSAGEYEIGGLPEGEYLVFAFSYSYRDELFDDIPCEAGECDLSLGQSVIAQLGSPATGVDFALDTWGALSGTLTDVTSGEPLASQRVEIWAQQGFLAGTDWTDSGGEFLMTSLDEGTYFVSTDTGPYFNQLFDGIPCPEGAPESCDVLSGNACRVTLNQTTEGIDFELARKPGIAGVVVDQTSGEPLRDILVSTWDESGDLVKSDRTDSEGRYYLNALWGGVFFVGSSNSESEGFVDELFDDIPCMTGPPNGCTPSSGTPVLVPSLGDATGIDFSLEPMGAIAGVASDRGSGEPVQGVRVHVFDALAREVDWASSGADGAYQVGGLTSGQYFVATSHADPHVDQLFDDVMCPGGAPDGCSVLTGAPVAVALGATTSGIDFALDMAGSISGTVSDEVSGEPISSAQVRLFSDSGQWLEYQWSSSSGEYEFSSTLPGVYFLTAAKTGFAGELFEGLPCPSGSGSSCDVTSGTAVEVGLGQAVTEVDFTLELTAAGTGAISGLVTDALTGVPLDRVRVMFYDEYGTPADYTLSGSDGLYSRGGLPVASYFVATKLTDGYEDELFDDVAAPEQGFDPTVGTPVSVTEGQTTRHIDLDLNPLGRITGRVTDSTTGQPVSSCRVELWNPDGSRASSATTGSEGLYVAKNLVPGVYFVSATDNDGQFIPEVFDGMACPGGPPQGCVPTSGMPVAVGTGEILTVDFSLLPRAGITGTVCSVGTNSPLPDATVRVWTADGLSLGDVHTDASGHFLVLGMDDGEYFVGARHSLHTAQIFPAVTCPGWPPSGCAMTDGTRVATQAGQTTQGVDFKLDRLGVISGTVADATTNAFLWGTEVRAFEPGSSVSVKTTYTDDLGRFSLTRMEPGWYFLLAEDYGYVDTLYPDVPCSDGPSEGGCDEQAGTLVEAHLNTETTGVDFRMVPARSSIRGTVTDADTGLPLDEMTVRCYDQRGHSAGGAETGPFGNFTLSGLGPGSHFVTAEGPWNTPYSTYLGELYDDIPCLGGSPGGCDPTKGTPIDVPVDGVVDGIDLALTGRLTGAGGVVIEALSGEPISGCYVDVWTENGAHWATVLTSAAGSFFVELYPGVFFLSTDNGQGLADEIWDGIACPGGTAFAGFCDPQGGDPVTAQEGVAAEGFNFALEPGNHIFADGFESGDLGSWTSPSGS